jgi:hypothetical protein
MWNDNMFWVLIAPGLVSCVCFVLEMSLEGFPKGLETIGRYVNRLW